MKRLMLISVILSLLLLSAHFLRFGNWGICAANISLAVLMYYRLAWVRWVLIAVLAFGIFVWADTGMDLVKIRLAGSQPWIRLSLIIGCVAGVTICSVSMLLTDKSKTFFNRDPEFEIPLAVIFLLTALTLGIARHMAGLPILLADRFFPGWGWLQIFLLGLYATWVGKKCWLAIKLRSSDQEYGDFFP